ncbi:MAG: trypsin-like peptidase domain-containing protein [Armatimonadota bacterium]
MSTTNRNTALLICVFSLLLAAALIGQQGAWAANTQNSSVNSEREALISIQNAFTSIAEEIKPAVVFITAERTITATAMPSFDIFRGWPFGDDSPFSEPKTEKRSAKSSGSGVIVRSDKNVSYIVTNDHVVASADRVTVKLDDEREFIGKVTRDPRTDIAIVKIDVGNLPAAKLADSDKVKVGQWAIAIGSPFQLTNSLTVGVVSAVMREAAVADSSIPEGGRLYPELIQTDASINPGNSGGPLVNIDGDIIGINSMIESPTGANAGIGFAVPSNTVKFVIDQLITSGKVVRGFLGVGNKDITPAAAKTLGVSKGALVESVSKGSPAEAVGIKPMDVIIELDGKKVDNSIALRRVVQSIKPGTNVPVVIRRDGKQQTLQIKLTEIPGESNTAALENKAQIGLTVQELTPALIERLGLPVKTTGVMVQSVEAGTPAGRAQPAIQVGDVITRINNLQITNVAQYKKAVAQLKSGDTALIVIQRDNTTIISELTID